MKQLLSLIAILTLTLVSFVTQAQTIQDQKTEIQKIESFSREDLLRRPPFFVVPEFEIKNAYDDAKEYYFKKLLIELKKFHTDKDFSQNFFSTLSESDLKKALDEKKPWEELIVDVKKICFAPSPLNKKVCDNIFELRGNYNSKYRRETLEDRKAEAQEAATKKGASKSAPSEK